MPSVSIIVPVYNGAEFLPGAVESVLSQTMPHWQLIIVDDGSTDGITPAMCDDYASKDKRIRVVHKQNTGQASARNYALQFVDTPYLAFLDADDELHPDFLKLTMETALNSDADIVFTGLDFCKGKFKILPTQPTPAVTFHTPLETAEKILYQTGFNNHPGGKIYRSTIWENLRFPAGRYYEDLHVSYLAVFEAEKIALIHLPMYGYIQREGSFIHTWSKKRLDVLYVTDNMLRWAQENVAELVPAAADRRMSAHFNILLLLYGNRLEDKELEQRCWRVIKEQRIKSLMDPKVRLRNRLGAMVSIIGGRPLLRWLARHGIGE